MRVRVEFFFVKLDDNPGGTEFADIVQTLAAQPWAEKLVGLHNGCGGIAAATVREEALFGELRKIQTDDLPMKGDIKGALKEIALRDGEGIAARTYFLYDPRRSVIAVHYNQMGARYSFLSFYCGHKMNRQVEFEVMLSREARERLAALGKIRMLAVKIARARDPQAYDNLDLPMSALPRMMADFGGGTIEVVISKTRKEESMIASKIRNVVSAILRGDHSEYRKLQLIGQPAQGGPDEVIDFLKDRITYTGSLPDVTNRRLDPRAAYDLLYQAMQAKSAEIDRHVA